MTEVRRSTIAIEMGGELIKLMKFWWGTDGSYYFSCPYIPGGRALLMKTTVNYSKQEQESRLEEALELALLEDDDRRLKVSHHPDGFLQFSGEGIRSGRNADGQPKGIGTTSWRVTNPTRGPSFGMSVFGLHAFARLGQARPGDLVFKENEMFLPSGWRSLHIEGYILPRLWARFVRKEGNGAFISLNHPTGAVLTMPVVFSPADVGTSSILAVEVYGDFGNFKEAEQRGGFLISTSTGNLRRSDEGELLGDGLFAASPVDRNLVGKSAAYGKDAPFNMPDPSYVERRPGSSTGGLNREG
jgi:hypothetical protein